LTQLGQTADAAFLGRLGLTLGPDNRPASDPDTFETEVPGLYVAGSLTSQSVDSIIKGREQALLSDGDKRP
jgi:thioredoxin reductase